MGRDKLIGRCFVWVETLLPKQVFEPPGHLVPTSQMEKQPLNLPANLECHILADTFNERFESATDIAKKRTDVAVCFIPLEPCSVTRIGQITESGFDRTENRSNLG